MADTKISALSTASTLDGTEQVAVVQGGVSMKTTVADIRTIDIVKVVGTDVSSTSVTPAAVSALDASLTPGTWLVKVWIAWQSTNTGTGIGLHLKANGGAVSRIIQTWYTLTTGTTATSGVADQASVAATFQTMEGRAQRANDTDPGPIGGTDTANADQFSVMEGIVIVTTTTTLQVMLRTETAGTGVSVQEGTTLTASKVA